MLINVIKLYATLLKCTADSKILQHFYPSTKWSIISKCRNDQRAFLEMITPVRDGRVPTTCLSTTCSSIELTQMNKPPLSDPLQRIGLHAIDHIGVAFKSSSTIKWTYVCEGNVIVRNWQIDGVDQINKRNNKNPALLVLFITRILPYLTVKHIRVPTYKYVTPHPRLWSRQYNWL